MSFNSWMLRMAMKLFGGGSHGKSLDAQTSADIQHDGNFSKDSRNKDDDERKTSRRKEKPKEQGANGDDNDKVCVALHIVRGVPGSGKTLIARKLMSLTGALFIEADQACIRGGEYITPPRCLRQAQSNIMPLHLANIMSTCICDGIYSDVLPTKDDLIRIVAPIKNALEEKGIGLVLNVIDAPMADVRESFEMSRHYDDMNEIKELCDAFEPFSKMDFDADDVD